MAKKFSDAQDITDIQKRPLGPKATHEAQSFQGRGSFTSQPRLGKALSDFVDKLEKQQQTISEIYSAGIVSGYTKELLVCAEVSVPACASFGESLFRSFLGSD